MIVIIVLLLIIALYGAPFHPYSPGWGYAPSSTLFIIVIILAVLLLTGRFR